MPRGGYRPGSGPVKGTKYKPRDFKADSVEKPAKKPTKKPTVKVQKPPQERQVFLSKAEEFALFYKGMLDRASQGKKPTDAEKKQMMTLAAELTKSYESGGENAGRSVDDLLPLDYMLRVMNDPAETTDMRARMAAAAAPYCHARVAEGKGKKDEKADRAKQAGAGKFAAGAPPLQLVK